MVAGVRLSPGEEVMLPRQLLMVTGHSGHLASPVSQLNLNQFAATSQPSPAQPSPALHRPLAFTSPPDTANYIWDWLPPTAHIQAFYNNQLEKLEAARSAYLWLPYWALLGPSGLYWVLLGPTGPY